MGSVLARQPHAVMCCVVESLERNDPALPSASSSHWRASRGGTLLTVLHTNMTIFWTKVFTWCKREDGSRWRTRTAGFSHLEHTSWCSGRRDGCRKHGSPERGISSRVAHGAWSFFPRLSRSSSRDALLSTPSALRRTQVGRLRVFFWESL